MQDFSIAVYWLNKEKSTIEEVNSRHGFDWLIEWLIDWLIDWLIGRVSDLVIEWLISLRVWVSQSFHHHQGYMKSLWLLWLYKSLRLALFDKNHGNLAVLIQGLFLKSDSRTHSHHSYMFCHLRANIDPYSHSFFSCTIHNWEQLPSDTEQ